MREGGRRLPRVAGWEQPQPIRDTRNLKPSCALGLPGPPSPQKPKTTLNNGYLGSRIDEERSEMRYVV